MDKIFGKNSRFHANGKILISIIHQFFASISKMLVFWGGWALDYNPMMF